MKAKAAKKRTRNPVETRRAILDAAFGEIFAHGFHASSVDAILEKTQLTKGALFHQFASKLELGYAVVDEVIAPMTRARWLDPLADFEDPIEGILHVVRANIADMPQADLNLGCPLNNLIQEMANSDREFQRRLKRVLEEWIEGIEAALKKGQKAGFVREGADVRRVAEYVVTAQEGAFGVIKGMRDKSVVGALVGSLEMLLVGIASG